MEAASQQTPPPAGGSASTGPSPASAPVEKDTFAERPELFVGAAFVGGVVIAQALRLLGR